MSYGHMDESHRYSMDFFDWLGSTNVYQISTTIEYQCIAIIEPQTCKKYFCTGNAILVCYDQIGSIVPNEKKLID